MKEGIEKLKKESKEKSAIERLQEIKQKEEQMKKEDPAYGSPWASIDPEKLIQEARDLFDIFDQGDLNVARTEIQVVREKIEKIKNKEARVSNEGFINWIDGEIANKLSGTTLKAEREQL